MKLGAWGILEQTEHDIQWPRHHDAIARCEITAGSVQAGDGAGQMARTRPYGMCNVVLIQLEIFADLELSLSLRDVLDDFLSSKV